MPKAKTKGAFLNDNEKLEFFAGFSGCDLNTYWYKSNLKIHENTEVLIYHYENGLVVFDSVLLCTNIILTDKGLKVTLVDKRTFKVMNIGEIPNKLMYYDLISHVPYKFMVERLVIRRSDGGRPYQNLQTNVVVRFKDNPKNKPDNVTFAINYGHAKALFSVEEFDLAIARLEAEDGYNE